MRRVSRLCAWLLGPLTLTGCVAGQPLPPGTVASSGSVLPVWAGGSVSDVCPPEYTCVVGRSDGQPRLPDSERAARVDGLTQLAEIAFPVDVSQDYQATRHDDATTVHATTRARLIGRLSAARTLESFWTRRREFSLEGLSTAHSAWVLLAVETARLERLYDEEMKRARTEGKALSARIAELDRSIRLADGPALAAELLTLAEIQQSAERLQPGPDRSAVLDGVRTATAWVDRHLTISQGGFDPDVAAGSATMRLSVRYLNRTAAALPLLIQGDCMEAQQTTAGPDGGLLLALTPGSRLKGCELTVSVVSVPTVRRTLSAPPLLRCGRFRAEVGVRGYLSARMAPSIAQAAQRLASVVETHLPPCPAGVDDTWVTVQAGAQVRPPRSARAGVTVSGGELQGAVLVTHRGRTVLRVESEVHLIKGTGRSTNEIRTGLEREIVGAVKTVLVAGLQHL